MYSVHYKIKYYFGDRRILTLKYEQSIEVTKKNK